MRRAAPGLLLVVALLCAPDVLRAEDDADHGNAHEARVAWFRSIPRAREVAADLGRPIFLAVHPRRATAHTAWPLDRAAWAEAYADPRVVEASRAFACVLHVVGAPPAPGAAGTDARPAVGTPVETPVHLVLDPAARVVLARVDDWRHPPGAPTVEGLLALLRAGVDRADPVVPGTPEVGPERVPEAGAPAPGSDPLHPAPVALDGPGFRTRLRWQLPVPSVAGAPGARVPAAVSMYWDGRGPFSLGTIEITPGTDVDVPVDVRFADHEALDPLLTRGRHRVDVYIAPVEGGLRFADRPLHVGLVWIDLGDGGGGGGGGGESEQEQPQEEPPPPEPEASPPQPDEGQEPPPLEAELEENEHVVEPFMRDGETVEKEDAIVAVESDDAGVKPPPAVPAEASAQELDKVLERSVSWERIPLAERAFLRRYFEALRKAVEEAESAGAGR